MTFKKSVPVIKLSRCYYGTTTFGNHTEREESGDGTATTQPHKTVSPNPRSGNHLTPKEGA